MHAVDGLVFDGGGPPAVGQDDLVRGDEVEADSADTEAGEKDGAGWVRFEGVQGLVAAGRRHGAVDAGVLEAVEVELLLDDVEELGPLGVDDCFGRAGVASGGFLARGFEDTEEGFDFAAADGAVDVCFRFFFCRCCVAELGGRLYQASVVFELGAAHGTFVLGFDDAFDAVGAEDVSAVGDDGVVVVQVLEANGAVFAGLDAELEHVLQGSLVLWG